MKKIMKNVAAATFAVAALAAPFAARAAADGDIFEIRPVDESGAAVANPAEPLDGGETARFAVRLAKPSASGNMFRLVHTGLNDADVDWVVNPPAIGIYVNGEFTLAYLESVKARNTVFTDFIFRYTVKPGDFAMPIRLAGSDKSLVTDTTQPPDGYYLNFLDSSLGVSAWKVDDSVDGGAVATRTANFWYGTPAYHPTAPESDGRRLDYDLSGCGFNVKTVDFDANDESTTYWRTFHEHATESQPVGAIPSFVVSGVPENAVTLYVWSENEAAAVLIAGRDVAKVTTRSVHVDQSTTESRQVAEIKVVAGKQTYEFNVRGVAQGNDATIVMSAFPDFNYNAGTGGRLDDYLTRTVRCVEPMPASVTVKPGKSTVTATSDYTTYVTELNVALSENPIAHDFNVLVEPDFTDTSCPNNWWDYFRLAATPDADPTLATPTTYPVLVFKAGETKPATLDGATLTDGKIYLYALRSDDYVTGAKKISFKVTTTDADAVKPSSAGGIDGWDTPQSSLTINAQNPVVESMFDGTDKATAVAGAGRTLQIVVSDVYADMQSDAGYEIWIEKNTDVDTQFTQIPGLYKPGKGNVLYKVGTTDTLPTVTYSDIGDINSTLYVVSPVSRNQSANHNFTVTVSTPAGYTVATTDEVYDYLEGDALQLKITLDKQNTLGDIYAYIKGENDASTAAINCKWKATAGGKGIKLKNYDWALSSGCTLVLLDGDASKLGSTYSYEVVFLTQDTWTDDSDKRVTAFQAKNTLVLTTHNVIPTVDTVTMGLYDIGESGSTVGGETNPAKFPVGIAQTFTLAVEEPGEIDKDPVDPGDRKFQVRWKFTNESGTTYGPTYPTGSETSGIVEGNPDDLEYKFDFPSSGKWTVTIDMRDKDMGNKWGNGAEGKTFVFYVNVIDQPAITVSTETPYNEQSCLDFGGEAKVQVDLELNNCTFDMWVQLAISHNKAGDVATFALQEGDDVVKVSDGVYNVKFGPGITRQEIFVQTMDGTVDSRTQGFKIVPTMVPDTTHVVPNSGGKYPHQYYVGVPTARVLVYNDAPLLDEEFDVYPIPGTNSIPASIGAADEAITWSFDDVGLDFARGITVEFKGGGGWGPKTYTDRDSALADGAAGWAPTFGNSGPQSVKLIVKDQDGGTATVIWNYEVAPSKTMKIVAHGPASGNVAKYSSAAGIGQGRVWAESKSAIAASMFSSTINCGLDDEWHVFGYGYKVGDVDDGVNLHQPDGFGGYTLGYYTTRDTPINGSGANLGTGTPFAYAAPLDDRGNPVDSFLYAWMLRAASSGGGGSGGGGSDGGSTTYAFLNEQTAPEYLMAHDSGKTVALPTEKNDDGSYAGTEVEAIFSIEYLASDNMGDINLDGIPDVYVNKYGFGQVNTEAGTSSGTDVAKLSAFNDDSDFLPVGETSVYGTLIPGIADTWATVGRPFTAKLEIRGNGESLNNATEDNAATRIANLLPDRVYTDPRVDSKSTLDGYDGSMPVEYLAWLDYAAVNGLDPADKANWTAWSPERPTDPTVDDTDGDGFPDGYEYFIWYRAHVGYNDGGVHRYLTGRKYDPRNPGEGKFIPAAEIAAKFDPAIANGAFSEDLDTDNDGLPDLIEFVIGTNPVDFDTDGDGLPDGFEILLAGTDPLEVFSTRGISDAMRNFDGDAMAYSSPAYEKDHVEPKPRRIKSLSSFALVDAAGDTDGLQWYVMPTADMPTDALAYTDWDSGYIVKAGRVEYVTTVKPSVVSDGSVLRLGADLSPTATWTTGVFTNTDDSVKLIRLMPTRLVAGTVLDAAPDTSATTNFGIVAFSAAVKDTMTAWPYGRSTVSTSTTGSNVANLGGFGFLAIGRYKNAPAGIPIAALPKVDATIAYLHHQVYQEFGFDPRTAWNANTPLGERWGRTGDGVDDEGNVVSEAKENVLNGKFPFVGIATRTREYTLYDEFLLMSFFLNGRADGEYMDVRPSAKNPWYTIWSRYTTNGRGPDEAAQLDVTENYKGRETINGSPDENGADTDGDGVPDGWELYVMAGPKRYDSDKGKSYFRAPAPYADGYLSSFGPFEPAAKRSSDTDNTAKDGNDTAGGDGDGLTEYQEFAGTDTTLYYAKYSTTVTRPEEHAKWLNKFFPTDPWTSDTDGDGRTDSQEKGDFAYGTPGDDHKLVTIPGGGLNPLTVDTDFDGLPDGWEQQFKGSSDSLYAVGKDTRYPDGTPTYAKFDGAEVGNPLEGLTDGMDGTVPDAYNVVNGRIEDNGRFSTYRRIREDGSKIFGNVNRDYDHDGLENWQEYMVGTMRCWRYDDILTQWDGIPNDLYWPSEGVFAPDYAAINAKYGKPGKKVVDTSAADGGEGEFWYRTLVDRSSPIYNPRLLSDQAPGDHYLSRVTNAWDVAYVSDSSGSAWYYFKDRIGDASLEDLWTKPFVEASGKTGKTVQIITVVAKPRKYISCSPLEYDTDRDGMDDYYELFHGMNPLLGASGVDLKGGEPCDVVFDAWHSDTSDTLFEAWSEDGLANNWTFQVLTGNYYKTGSAPRGTGYDFEYYPWLNGLAAADPDGDDVRNQVEAILPKMATKTWLHTDPTPLWMTDSNYARSLTCVHYRMPGRDLYAETPGESFEFEGKTYYFADFGGWAPANLAEPDRFVACKQDQWWQLYGVGERNWMFSFEENEGYDSDHDAMSDSTETQGRLRAASDPQDANSPNRRQAMYFQGPAKPSALQTPPEIAERYPVVRNTWPDETTFLTFTVEAWVYAESLDNATIVERAIWCDPSKAGDEEFVRKNFQLGVRGKKWYAKYDANGTLADSSVEAYSEDDAKSGEWHHVAATYDGASFSLYVDGEQAMTPISTTRQPEYGSSALVIHREWAKSTSNGNPVFANGDYCYDTDYALRTIVVGASLKTQAEGGIADAFDVRNGVGWGRYNRFFKGYIDEVRIWDGARTIEAVRADYRARKRYVRDTALENREAFYGDWEKNGMRNRYMKDAGGGAYSFVPELRYHFSFDSVPGGSDEGIAAKVPAGFDHYQPPALGYPARGAAVLSRPTDWNVAWWAKVVNGDGTTASPGFGSVYSSDQWVQWVPNTMTHLPRFDGTTLDSFFWSDNTCGGTNGTYYFTHTAEPASLWTQLSYNGATGDGNYAAPGSRHHLVCELDGISTGSGYVTSTNDFQRFNRYRFSGRYALQDGLDLLPLGGAYAKACDDMWDSQGASTPWEITSDDSDFNGLPDSWEEYAVANYSPETEPLEWGTIVTWNGKRMPAGDAYLRDLAKGRSIDTNSSGTPEVVTDEDKNEKRKQIADEDASRTPDWWDDLYGVYGAGGTTDSDNDGLNNYVEYLVSEIFPFDIVLDPKKPMSDSKTLDYFRKVGKLYLGEMFTDHDHMEDHWERAQGSATVDPNVWDANRDGDEDGWSNFAEARAVDDQSTWVQMGSRTNLYTVTFDIDSNERSIFDATNTATIALTEMFNPDGGWRKDDGRFSSDTKIRYTVLGYEPIMGYGGRPTPKVDMTVYYNGNLLKGGDKAQLVVKAYSSDEMFVPDAIFVEEVARGVNRLTLHEPKVGSLKAGRNNFAAYISLSSGEDSNNGSGSSSSEEEETAIAEYQTGYPFGVAMNVEVGWNSARATIDLTETSVETPRIKLWEELNSDRFARFGSAELSTGMASTLPASEVARVRVVRYKYDNTSVAMNNYRVIFDKKFDLRARDYLHEGDVRGGAPDIDWDYLAGEMNGKTGFSTCTNMLYLVLIGDDVIQDSAAYLPATMRVHPLLVSRRFEKTHTPPTNAVVNAFSVCTVAQPTFSWRIVGEDKWASAFGTSYTAFRVVVKNSAGDEVYNSGYQRMPVADANGEYNWTAPLYAGCPSPSGNHLVFHNLSNYTWQVFTYNSKFKNDAVGTIPQTFRLLVTELNQTSFSTGVDVRYAGPAVNLANRVRVQAFKTPDFSGMPVAEAVTNTAATVRLTGLRAGTYFLRAYIDTDYDWTLDPWESWGYLSERDHAAVAGTKAIFSPVSVTVGPEIKGETPRVLYIEDRDTDGDGFPDVWEAEQNGNVFDREFVKPVTGDAEFIAVNTNLTASLSDCIPKSKMELLLQTLRLTIGGKYGAALLTGAPASSFKLTSSGALRVDSSVVEDTLAITSLGIDRGAGEIVLGVAAETEGGSIDPDVAALYSFERGAYVTLKVYHTETLAAEWTLAATIENVSLSSDGTEVHVKLPEGLDTSSGFFKVEIE